jgi:hypothetical protein
VNRVAEVTEIAFVDPLDASDRSIAVDAGVGAAAARDLDLDWIGDHFALTARARADRKRGDDR